MSACITLTRTETTLSCAWSWHSDLRAATEAGDAERVANISATGRRKPRPGLQHQQPIHFLYSGRYRIFLPFRPYEDFYEANELQLRASCSLGTMRYDLAIFRSFLQRYQGLGEHTGSAWWYSYPLFSCGVICIVHMKDSKTQACRDGKKGRGPLKWKDFGGFSEQSVTSPAPVSFLAIF